ncbi:DUF554 family protein [Peribacillus simplex]|uniref:DUF554 family protein n=1 Tax=Peribacillus simplex TaxID=1478 RepID=UPI000F63D127|nr:DUF554 family protein [Peribacillus simplex]RRN70222.1 DUF554 family protein [Peribacillus simplex]
MIDGFTSIVLASTLGVGVPFSEMFRYQGEITIYPNVIKQYLSEPLLAELTATCGALNFVIGENMLGIKQIRVAFKIITQNLITLSLL